MKTCFVAVTLGPFGDLKSPCRVSDLVSPFSASTMLLMFGEPMSSCNGWYGSRVTESFNPGTRSSDRRVPPNILVIGEPVRMVPEDLVIAAFCFGPTCCQTSPSMEPRLLKLSLVGDDGTLAGVATAELLVELLDFMT